MHRVFKIQYIYKVKNPKSIYIYIYYIMEKIGEFIKNMNIPKKDYFQRICPLYSRGRAAVSRKNANPF